MAYLSIIISLALSVAMSLLLNQPLFTTSDPDLADTFEMTRVGAYINISGFYLFLIFALLCIAPLVIIIAKKKTTKLIAFACSVLPSIYYIYAYGQMTFQAEYYVKYLHLPESDYLRVSGSATALLIAFIVFAIFSLIIFLVSMAKNKVEENVQNQAE